MAALVMGKKGLPNAIRRAPTTALRPRANFRPFRPFCAAGLSLLAGLSLGRQSKIFHT
jgi:hypothetical protein